MRFFVQQRICVLTVSTAHGVGKRRGTSPNSSGRPQEPACTVAFSDAKLKDRCINAIIDHHGAPTILGEKVRFRSPKILKIIKHIFQSALTLCLIRPQKKRSALHRRGFSR